MTWRKRLSPTGMFGSCFQHRLKGAQEQIQAQFQGILLQGNRHFVKETFTYEAFGEVGNGSPGAGDLVPLTVGSGTNLGKASAGKISTNMMNTQRVVIVVLDIILAAPQDLYGRPDFSGYLNRISYIIHLETPAKTTADSGHM